MDGVRTLKANMKMAGKPCGWCQTALQIGEDAAVCTPCEAAHHGRCWELSAGCATGGCVNAPLRRLDGPAQSAPSQLGSPFPQAAPFAQAASFAQDPPLSPGLMRCPRCRHAIVQGAPICPMCRGITSPDGIYHGVKVTAPGATAALVYGIIGLFFCGVILGPVAISKSNDAKRAMSSDPTLGGEGLATAGMVLGIVDLILWAILLVLRMGSL